MHLLIQDRFWVVHIPFVLMVIFKLRVQLIVDHLPQSRLVLYSFYAYYVLERFSIIFIIINIFFARFFSL